MLLSAIMDSTMICISTQDSMGIQIRHNIPHNLRTLTHNGLTFCFVFCFAYFFLLMSAL